MRIKGDLKNKEWQRNCLSRTKGCRGMFSGEVRAEKEKLTRKAVYGVADKPYLLVRKQRVHGKA